METVSIGTGIHVMIARWISFVTGVWLASLQVGFFLLLETYVTATYLVYFFVVAVWLIGMMAGLSFNSRYEFKLMVVALVAFYLAAWCLHLFSRDAALLVTLPCVALCGVYSGQFFLARRRLFPHISQLFWWENTGFLVGWVLSMGSWLWMGESAILWIPFGSFVCILGGRKGVSVIS